MCMAFGKLPSDPFWEKMDPMERMWLFQSWAYKNEVRLDEMKHQAIFIGSFSNLEMAKKLSKEPDYESTDEDFEASTKLVLAAREKELKGINNESKRKSRRKRKLINR